MLNEIRLGWRALLRRPVLASTAVISVGLGIAANATVYSLVNALLLRPLPYAEPERLVAVWPERFLANREIAALRERSHALERVAAFSPGWLMALTNIATPRQMNAARVSVDFFDLLGVRPALGRGFAAQDEHRQSAVLSEALWRREFGADPAILGRTLRLDGSDYTVIGVMPREFRSFDFGTDLWTPLPFDPAEGTWAGASAVAYARLRPGASVASASAELQELASRLRTEFQRAPDWARGAVVVELRDSLIGSVRTLLLVLQAAVAFLLLIAVANVANLLLVRTEERRPDLAVRVALGATPRQLARLVLGESLVIGGLGLGLAALLTLAGVALLRQILPPDLPRLSEVAFDAPVVLLALLLAGGTTAVCGLVPALRASSAVPAARLRAGRSVTGGGARTRGALVAVEVALALVLTLGATLMGRTLIALYRVDPGLRSDHLLTLRLQPSGRESEQALRDYWSQVLARVRSVPGVAGAATLLHLPTSGRSWHTDVAVEGRVLAPGQSPPRTAWQSVSPGYFGIAGVPLLRGRDFGDSDGPEAERVVAVSSTFAANVFPDADPIGHRLRLGNATRDGWARVVAVVGSVRHAGLETAPEPEVYVPFAQRSVVANSLVVRTTLAPLQLAAAIREQVAAVDPAVPISDLRTMDDLFAGSVLRQRMALILLGLFAGVGLLLSAVGTYGVVAHGVSQRLREIGIRSALGARPAAIQRLVVAGGMRPALAGIATGIPLALALSRLMRGLVFGVPTTDVVSFTLAPLLLVLVVTLACWLPARRATTGDPLAVLRE